MTTLGQDDTSVRRSDGVSIAWVLEHTPPDAEDEQRRARLAGYYDCRDPQCPEWSKRPDAFWKHLHKVKHA